jgi:hypothetical protein
MNSAERKHHDEDKSIRATTTILHISSISQGEVSSGSDVNKHRRRKEKNERISVHSPIQ